MPQFEGLDGIKPALAQLIEPELKGLIDAARGSPPVAPRLLAWIDAACDWELNRRDGRDYELQPPDAAIPDDENAKSIAVAQSLRSVFAKDSPRVRRFFDALVGLLTGEGRKQ